MKRKRVITFQPVEEIKPVAVVELKQKPAQPGEEISLSRYFMIRGIRPQHRGGRKAFTSVEKATLEKWDEIFSGY